MFFFRGSNRQRIGFFVCIQTIGIRQTLVEKPDVALFPALEHTAILSGGSRAGILYYTGAICTLLGLRISRTPPHLSWPPGLERTQKRRE